ncbi:MAG: hypothetical protein CSA07_03410 [Bacteroidia bacterium]|nr:MAG: hypothetical protein CSA07_03410 [Bacteroidia bacterium]
MRYAQLIALLLTICPLVMRAAEVDLTVAPDEEPEGLLEELFPRKRNINHITHPELLDIPGVSPAMADSILAFRRRHGPLLSPYELAYIPLISPQQAQHLLRFVRVAPPIQGPDSSLFAHQELDAMQRLGYRIPLSPLPPARHQSDQTRPQGGDLRLTTRLTYQAGRWLKIGLKGAKTRGEPFLHSFNPYGYGWYSGYVEISPTASPLKRIVAGSFTLTTGYGITYSSTLMRWTSQQTHTLAQRAILPRGVLDYQGADYPRGLATTLRLHRSLWLTAAYAVQRINATLDTAKSPPTITSRNPQAPTTTYAQLRSRRSNWQQQGIIDLHYTTTRASAGASTMLLHNEHPFDAPYPKNRGKIIPPRTLVRTGLYARMKLERLELFGETSMLIRNGSPPGKLLSHYLGLSLPLLPTLSLGAYYYAYGEHTVPLYTYAYATANTPVGSQGTSLILEFRPTYRSGIHARFQTEMPETNPLTLLNAKERRRLRLWAYYAERNDWRTDLTYSLSTQQPSKRFKTPPITHRHHLHASYRRKLGAFSLGAHALANATLRYMDHAHRYGYGLALDGHYEASKWQLKGRIAYYDTQRSRSPLYIHEPAPRYSFSVGMLTRHAIRGILLLEYRPIYPLRLTLSAAKSFYLNHSLDEDSPRDQVLRQGLDLQLQLQYTPRF